MVIRHEVSQYKRPKRKALKVILLSILVIILGVGIWVGAAAYNALSKVTSLSGNGVFSFFSDNHTPLKGESDGRTNILLLGYGGSGHSGGNLSDTMQVLSIDWKTNKIAMISIPRDLWVNVPGHGYSRINKAYSDGGGQLSSDVVSNILGIPIHYFVSMDFNGFIDIVDKVGGVDINVEHNFTDYSYPKSDCNEATGIGCALMTVNFDAGLQHMDGARALIYARSRHSLNNGEGTDFARSRRQQLALLAIKEKIMNLDILANPVKITSLMKTVGNHLKTNLSVPEIKSLWDEIKKIGTSNIISEVIDNSPNGVLKSMTTDGGADVQIPKKGIGIYTDLQEIAKNIFDDVSTTTSTPSSVDKTDLKIEVLNGSGQAGQGTKAADALKKLGYTITSVATTTKTAKSIVYNCAGTTSQTTATKIAEDVHASATNKTSCGSVDIQVVIGQDALAR